MGNRESMPTVDYSTLKHFTNKDKKKIVCEYWEPIYSSELSNPRALVFICHGFGEHCRYYDKFSKPLQEKGILTFSHDHVGHGLSEGEKANTHSFQIYLRDMFEHTDMIKEKYPDIPLFVIAHSMGGSISIMAAYEKPDYLAGLVLISAALQENPVTATPIKMTAAKLTGSLAPSLQIAKIIPNDLCRDQDHVKRYENDPLVWHGGIKAGWASQMLKTIEDIRQNESKVTCPLLILHGTNDNITEHSGSRRFHDKASSTDKTLKIFDGAFHQLHYETSGIAEEVVHLTTNWIDSHIQ